MNVKPLLGLIESSCNYDLVVRTDLSSCPNLTARVGSPVFAKREDEQPTGSFKIRGASNQVSRLDGNGRPLLITTPPGHAYAVAFAARHYGHQARALLPSGFHENRIRDLLDDLDVPIQWSDVSDKQFDALYVQKARADGFVLLEPYEDDNLLAGYGVAGTELLEQSIALHASPPDRVFVPIGGGGLGAALAAVVKTFSPSTRVIGVQLQTSDSMIRSLRAGKRVRLAGTTAYATDVATIEISPTPFKLVRQFFDDFIVVTAYEVRQAIKEAFVDLHVVLEPAGALGIAGLLQYKVHHGRMRGLSVVVASGRNLDIPSFSQHIKKDFAATQPVYDVFVSHASEDKHDVAEPLVRELVRLGIKVWYDTDVLQVGDSLRRAIDHGLSGSSFGVVVVSDSFLSKEWPQKELDALAARESGGQKVILPVWHGVNATTLRTRSPLLADRVAISTSAGIPTVARKLALAMGLLKGTQ